MGPHAWRIRAARRLTDLLSGVPGVRLVPAPGGLGRIAIQLRGSLLSHGGSCHPRVIIDEIIVIRGDARPRGLDAFGLPEAATETARPGAGRPEIALDDVVQPEDIQAVEVYRSSAQLFLTELLRLKDGRACLRGMLAELPRHYNWQFAFLTAFHSSFQRTLDVEKWWTLQILHFTGRDLLAQTWTFEQSRQRLEQVLRAPVEIHVGTNALPVPADVTLQQVIREWDGARQTQALQARVREMDLLRGRVAQEFVALVDNYRRVLQTYLQHPDKTGFIPWFGKKGGLGRVAEETLNQLDELDSLRAVVRPAQKPVAARQP